MIIDCHGHYTTAPEAHTSWREAQRSAFDAGEQPPPYPDVSDDDIRRSLEGSQLRLMRERGVDLTLFSPRASAMGHHVGDEAVSTRWTQVCNDLIARVVALYPQHFAGVCQLPQSPGVPIVHSVAELRRCVRELGFVGCNLNPDPSGGHWTAPPLTDRSWYPFYEAMVELDVPAMVHVSAVTNPAFHATGSHYLNADTTAFMQFLQADLFRDFPGLRFVVPHGGGAVPYHWGRFRGLADMLGRPAVEESLMGNVFFDTCVYHQAGIGLLFDVIDVDNILFGSEMVGAVRGIDPRTGHHFDDTRRYVDALDLIPEDRAKVYELNTRRVYPRLDAALRSRVTSRASVPTDRPGRYGKQLVAHLSRRNAGVWDDAAGTGWLDLRGGRATLSSAEGALGLEVSAAPDDVARLEDVVGRHLVRFGSRDELVVRWSRSDGTGGTVQEHTGDA